MWKRLALSAVGWLLILGAAGWPSLFSADFLAAWLGGCVLYTTVFANGDSD
jgi:hypothetical protein